MDQNTSKDTRTPLQDDVKPYKTSPRDLYNILYNLAPFIAIPRNKRNYSPSNYTCIDAEGCPETHGGCNAKF